MIGRVGEDDFGAELLAAAAHDGVDTTAIARDPQAATGVALITVDDSGQNSIVVASGANWNVSPADVDQHVGLIKDAALLVMQLECPLQAVLAAARVARQAGVRVLLNPAPARPLPTGLLAMVDILTPNQTELSMLVDSELPLQQAAQELIRQGVPQLLVTLGTDGAYLANNQGEFHLPPYPVTAVDTVAAGDAFVGALAVALAEGKPMEQAARWGNAAGALAVTRYGAQPSLPTRAELLAFLEKNTQ
jgi:ribokinase